MEERGPTPEPEAEPPRRGRLRFWLTGYVLLLVLSHAFGLMRQRVPRAPSEARDERRVELPLLADGGERVVAGEETAPLVYRDVGPRDGVPLVLLHGSPGSSDNFDGVVSALEGSNLRLVIPDLPGFGRSRASLPDYSIVAHARYLARLLDELQLESVHVAGYSMGGGVALELYDAQPERVRSLALVAAIGVQELELFGRYELNHAVHGLQLWLFRGLRWFVPHFGAFDVVFGEPYPRNFYDTDQRPLRGILERFEPPARILHGPDDFLVPYAAGVEHRRIVPQAELVDFEDGHFFPFTRPTRLADELRGFVERVEAGEVPGRAQAEAERIAAASAEFDPRSAPPFAGPALLVMFLIIAVSTFVSEDLTCIAAGLLVAQGRMGLASAASACIAGIFIGDIGLFLLGRWLGRPAMDHAPMKWILKPESLERAAAWLDKKGVWAIFLSRFMPGTRLPLYFFAGVLRTKLARFALFFLLAALIWTPLLVGLAAWLGEKAAMDLFHRFGLWALVGVALAFLVVERLVLRLFTWRGRRELVGAFRRWTQFEFWPPWLFYLPVVPYIAWLGLRHRSLAVVTAVNPGIPTGGFIGESKIDILERIAGPGVARHCALRVAEPPAQRRAQLEAWLDAEQLDAPLVVKPDVGQRGSGVRILRSRDAALREAESLELDELAQEYVTGVEYGVFWLRRPGAERGELFSITHKIMPQIEGDGEHTVEELILRDPRAVVMAKTYLHEHPERLSEVLPRGEKLTLVQLGTHCRGAIFADAQELATPELLDAVEDIATRFPGFDFGRFDLRVPTPEHLTRGEGLGVIELNGVTSEATHIYDPRTGVLEAYRVLWEQWRTAFAIGAANRKRGVPTTGAFSLLRRWWRYRGEQAGHR